MGEQCAVIGCELLADATWAAEDDWGTVEAPLCAVHDAALANGEVHDLHLGDGRRRA